VDRITVSIPATSANLGPGFDVLGIALDLWNDYTLLPDQAATRVDVTGEGAGKLPTDASNLIARTVHEEFKRITGTRLAPFHLACTNRVPAGSGLGSSSTAVLGGLLLAHALTTRDDAALCSADGPVLRRAIELEGHGDNVAPALIGGLVMVSTHEGHAITRRLSLPPTTVAVCVPDYHFLTTTARSVVPTQLSRGDAIFNIGRAVLVVEALRSGDLALLARAQDDRIHEPYRIPAIPGAAEVKRAALDAGAASVALSGAGPGVIAFAATGHAAIGAAMVQAFAEAELHARAWTLPVIDHGARITRA
jgi:homoserine kinase